MNDVPYDEAAAILAISSVCPDAVPWIPKAKPIVQWVAGSGLLDEDGNPRGLQAELRVTRGTGRLGMLRFKFSVFRASAGGLERVYQLDTAQWPRLPNDRHSWPHEHVGTRRNQGDASWARWTYDDALRRFCQSTNIRFDPEVPDPFDFRLTPG